LPDPPPAGVFYGSSPNSGERRPDLEEEVGVIAVAIGGPLDDLDPVVDAFDQTGVHRPADPAEDAAPVRAQALGEVHQGRDAALPGVAQPLVPSAAPAPGRGRGP